MEWKFFLSSIKSLHRNESFSSICCSQPMIRCPLHVPLHSLLHSHHPPIQNSPQKTICYLFSRVWHEIKNKDWAFEQESRKTSFPLVCFSVNEIFRLYHGQKATSVLFVFYTLCCIRPNRSRSHGVSMNPRCDTAVSDENEKCGKMLENNNF